MPSVQVIQRRPDTRRQALGAAIAQAGDTMGRGFADAARLGVEERRYGEQRQRQQDIDEQRQQAQDWQGLHQIFQTYPDDPDTARAAAHTLLGERYSNYASYFESGISYAEARDQDKKRNLILDSLDQWGKAYHAAEPEQRRGLLSLGQQHYGSHDDPQVVARFQAHANPDVDLGDDAREAAIKEARGRFREDMSRRGSIRDVSYERDAHGQIIKQETTETPSSPSPNAAQSSIRNLAQELSRGDVELAIDIADSLYGEYESRAPNSWQRPSRQQLRAQYEQRGLQRAAAEPGGLPPAVQAAMGEQMPNPMMEAMTTPPRARIEEALAPGMVQGPNPQAEAALQQSLSPPPSPGAMMEAALAPGLNPPPGPGLPPAPQPQPAPPLGPQVLGEAMLGPSGPPVPAPGPQAAPGPPQQQQPSDMGTIPSWYTQLSQDPRLPSSVKQNIEQKRREGMGWEEILYALSMHLPAVYDLIHSPAQPQQPPASVLPPRRR